MCLITSLYYLHRGQFFTHVPFCSLQFCEKKEQRSGIVGVPGIYGVNAYVTVERASRQQGEAWNQSSKSGRGRTF